MTERQQLIARKRDLQAARNRLRHMEGLKALEPFELQDNPRLCACWKKYAHTFLNGQPISRLPWESSTEAVCAWLRETLRLEAGEWYYFCQSGAVWTQIQILDPSAALRSLWAERDFLLIDVEFRRILGAGFDSRDEEYFLADLLELAPEEIL